MRILVIDDIRTFDDAILHCRTYDEGIQALKDDSWDLLLLDHDLGCYDDAGREWTGYDVIKFLEQHPTLLPGKIQLVTANPVGRQVMQKVIDRLYG